MRSISRGSKHSSQEAPGALVEREEERYEQFERVSLEEVAKPIEAPNIARTLNKNSLSWEDDKSSDNTTFFKEVI